MYVCDLYVSICLFALLNEPLLSWVTAIRKDTGPLSFMLSSQHKCVPICQKPKTKWVNRAFLNNTRELFKCTNNL